MTTQYTSGRTSSGSFFTILLSLVLGAAAVVVFLRHASGGIPARLSTLITGRASAADLSVPTITARLQQLNRLQTVLYTGDVILQTSSSSPALPDTVSSEQPLLVAHGEITAGVDLAHLRPEDLRIDPATRAIHVHLPASELFSTTLDPQQTRAYSRLTGLPAAPAADTTLTPEAHTRAQSQLQQAALQSGLLDLARKNARQTVTTFLLSLGFTEVDVL